MYIYYSSVCIFVFLAALRYFLAPQKPPFCEEKRCETGHLQTIAQQLFRKEGDLWKLVNVESIAYEEMNKNTQHGGRSNPVASSRRGLADQRSLAETRARSGFGAIPLSDKRISFRQRQ
jgi:hypothetical protein